MLATEEPVVLLGDYNVIPQAEDAAKPKAWEGDALFLPESRAAFRRMVNLGFTDALLARNPRPGIHVLGLSGRRVGAQQRHPDRPCVAEPAGGGPAGGCGNRQTSMRAGEKPSDHVPVWIDLTD